MFKYSNNKVVSMRRDLKDDIYEAAKTMEIRKIELMAQAGNRTVDNSTLQ